MYRTTTKLLRSNVLGTEWQRRLLQKNSNPSWKNILEHLSPSLQWRLINARALSTQPPALKPWPSPMVESNGDYREEAFLEEHIGGPLYQYQKELPKLPVPSIADTLERFLPTALPLCRSEEETRALQNDVQSFESQAQHLQSRLLDRQADFDNSSWLQQWWNQLGYLQVRDSVVINVSYFFHFANDPTALSNNVARAATMLYGTAEFRRRVASGTLEAERVGKSPTPLCATAYKYMFHACRIPKAEQDSYRIYDPSLYQHAIVARRGHFFAMPIVNADTGAPLPLATLEEQLTTCMALADRIPNSRPKLGLLTSSNRDRWAKAREVLLREGGRSMEQALERLESGAILLCLDDESPQSRHECGEIFLSGGLRSGHNRWFDKSIQIMVQNNGVAGILGEHSMMDGMPLVNYADYITNLSYEDAKKRSNEHVDGASNHFPEVEDIFGDALCDIETTALKELEDDAWEEFEEHITLQSNTAQSFQGYGSAFMKEAGHSPDAYVQVAMQLATYRLFGEQVGTYEATQVRPFLHGRTETTRSVSLESAAFVLAMGLSPKFDEDELEVRKKKLDLLQKATMAHSQYTRTAAQAQGVDRHFFGLSMLVQDEENTPDLFKNPVFARSKRWRVSTSHLTHPKFVNWGFGEVVPDGVGIGYSIQPKSCVFNIYALEETGWTFKLAELLEESLLEIGRLVEFDKAPTSKL